MLPSQVAWGPMPATTLAQLLNTEAIETRGAGAHPHVLTPWYKGCLLIIQQIFPFNAPTAHKATWEEQKLPGRDAVFCSQFLMQVKGGKADVPSPFHGDTLASSPFTTRSNFSRDYPTVANRTPCRLRGEKSSSQKSGFGNLDSFITMASCKAFKIQNSLYSEYLRNSAQVFALQYL